MTREADVCVVGAGPSGLALSSQLARRGLTVVCVGPDEAWPARYSMWLDEARALGAEAWLASTWPRTIARTPGAVHELDAYATLDNARGAAGLLALGGPRLIRVASRSIAVTSVADGRLASPPSARASSLARSSVHLDDGTHVQCRAVVGAAGTGALARSTTGTSGTRGAAQTAWGAIVEARDVPDDVTSGDAAVLMAFDGATGEDAPSFLYALPLADGRVFLEETSLAGAPPVDIDVLRARLEARVGRSLVATERCFIALDARPVAGSFGAAAGLVHPCTGYSVATSWRLAPIVADALAEALARDDGGARVTSAIDGVLFSKRRQRARALHRLGLDLLLGLDARATASFFHTVFSAPNAVWRTFLDGDPDPDVLLHAMTSLFTTLERPLRASLSRLVLRRHLRQVPALVPALARTVLGGATP